MAGSRRVSLVPWWLGVLASVALGCVQPTVTHCPDVDCPKNEVCDNRGGCALPEQLAICAGKDDGASCGYTDNAGRAIDGACTGGLCLPRGCGNSILTPDEVCDDGNTVNGDGCSADCKSDETCGNGLVDPARGEQCDDHNAVDGDGCQASCKNPRCGDGIRDEGLNEACDQGAQNSAAPDAACRPSCQLPRCGDGVVDPSLQEVCDDGNVTSGDGCAGDCKSTETCGNHVVDVVRGEVCDDGNVTGGDGCSSDCHSTEGCGNGILDADRGEVCDDGNIVSGDGCSSDCRSLETCGNGIVDTLSEQCDKGAANSVAPDAACRPDCRLPACGDGIVDLLHGEKCDAGAMNADARDACRTTCQLPRCGDAIADTGEVCDDGNSVAGDGCAPDCKSNETCGNGVVDVLTEQCDAGALNGDTPDAPCRAACRLPTCGDGITDPLRGELCDLGAMNASLPDTCRPTCVPPRCGDAIVDSGETCDDGNAVAGDGCSPDCRSTEICGNGIVDTAKGEQCDAAAQNSTDPNAPCRPGCKLPTCGDGITDPIRGEACDAGAANANTPNAPCRTSCQLPRCGDGLVDTTRGEVCDDGNTAAGDGCSADCRSAETCGNGIVDLAKGEQCDAGAANANTPNAPCRTTCKLPSCGDGIADTTRGEACDLGTLNANTANANCRTNCQPQRCGDGIKDPAFGEVCDDANVASGDGCSADCRSLETCGNGIVDVAKGEQCDDGNAVNADFCHTNCTLPRCGDAIVDFNEQCDAGASNSGAANAPCRTTCVLPRCGDGVVDTSKGEVCDDGNLITADGCRPDCLSNETCGNGIVDNEVGEQCDDGNGRGRDGCSACRDEDAVVLSPGKTPPARGYHAIAYDAARQRVVMFGGYGGSGPLGDTWEWDGASWTQMHPRHSPAPRYFHAMTYDAARRRVVLFGGYNNNYRSDTWTWDGVDWTDTQVATHPPASYEHAIGYDANSGKVIFFGGYTATGYNTATWAWDGAAWTQLVPAASPSYSYGRSMAFDAARKLLIMAGGGGGDTNTWAWTGTTWVSKGTSPLPTNVGYGMAYDPARGVVVAVGPATYEWNGTSWTTAATTVTNREGTVGAYDTARKQLVLFGGYLNVTPYGYQSDTQLRTGTAWAAPAAWTEPSARFRAAAGYDPMRKKVVVFGGQTNYSYAGTGFLADTWEWDGRRWSSVAATTPPTARGGQTMDYNSKTRTLMLYGGVTGTTTPVWDSNVYAFNGTAWALQPSTGRTIARNPTMSYDANADRLVAFGGIDTATGTTVDTTYYWDALGWHLASPAARPTARQNASSAYDAVRKRVVVFGGRDPSYTQSSEVAEWDGATWTRSTAAGPDGRYGFTMFYNPDRGRAACFGSSPAGAEDLWEWSGASWTQRSVDTAVASRYRAAVAYDAARHALVTFGGRDKGSYATLAGTQLIQYRPNAAVEACTGATLDYDNDGKAGCADDDCWSVCTPLCPPGTTCPTTAPKCGDGVCGAFEDCGICPTDCGACAGGLCGDFRCDAGETRTSCPTDC